ncbi:MAG TPA: M20/M25/M40 family metallo-hydrolase, partial [Candidatus Limnocylindrales bacterium]|nr:M20/M25/M40 family metallo-hydrolase [Candidatus Limnocylindrales bacterium]
PTTEATIETESTELLRTLIRNACVNTGEEASGGESRSCDALEAFFAGSGLSCERYTSSPGRMSLITRIQGSDPKAPTLLLMGHTDVVPVSPSGWTRDPFAAELVDGVVWGRGAIDMLNLTSTMAVATRRLRTTGWKPRGTLIYLAVADEEAGGTFGALHWVRERPDLFADAAGRPAAAALNEVGGYSMTIGGRRAYAIQVAEKGIIWTRLRASGTPSHGSMPSPDNAAIKLAAAVSRLAAAPRPARLIPVVRRFFDGLGLGEVATLAEAGRDDEARTRLAAQVDDAVMRRSLDAMLRDTVTPNVIHVGKKVNVVPGSGEAEVDVRTLPGTDQAAFLAHLQEVAGPDVLVESVHTMPPVECPPDAEIVRLMHEALLRADPDATPLPMMITPGTDAKAMSLLGIPTYGFAPLRLDADVPFLSLFHANDERIPISGLRFGLPVLHEVVRGFAAVE